MTGKCALRSDDHTVRGGVDGHDIERPVGFIGVLAPADAKPAPLPDGEIDHAVMRAKNRAVEMHDLPRLDRAWPEPPHHIAVATIRHKADVLTVGLVGHGQTELRRKPPRRSRSAAHKEGAGRIGRQALTASHAEASAGELACPGSWRVASDSWAPPPPPLKSSGGGAHALTSTMHSPGKGWGQGQG